MLGILKNKSQYYKENNFLARDGVQYPRMFPIHPRNFTFITQEIPNALLKKFEGPLVISKASHLNWGCGKI